MIAADPRQSSNRPGDLQPNSRRCSPLTDDQCPTVFRLQRLYADGLLTGAAA